MARTYAQSYDNGPYSLEKILGIALFASLGLHILASWVFFFVVPAFQSARQEMNRNIVVVELMGALAPPAPAAPNLEVDPKLKGPDVVELPSTPPPVAKPIPTDPEPLVSVPDPAEVIPIADKKPETPPVIEKTQEKPPKVTPPPKKEVVKPKKPNLDAQIANSLKNLEREQKRKVAAENTDDLINQKMANLALARGQGQGEGSDMYGGASSGVRLDPEKERYYRHIRDIVSKNWVAPANAMSANLSAVYQIRIEPSGQVSASLLRISSGNSDYDESVQRAVQMSSPFPQLPAVFGGQADNPALRFGLSDMRQGSY